MKIFIFTCILIAAVMTGCNHDRTQSRLEDCPYGKPKAVFHSEMPGVSEHGFSATAYDATEQFLLDNKIRVTLIQSGCEKPVQEFRFEWTRGTQEHSNTDWTSNIIQLLKRLAALDPKTAPLNAWAQAIEAMPQDWVPGEAREIQPGTLVKMDTVGGDQEEILVLILGADS